MPRTRRSARPLARLVPLSLAGLAVSAATLSCTATTDTFGYLTAAKSSGGNSFTAAVLSAPTGFTATATGGTTAALAWTAPATLTGYTLTQSPGTLAGCSATPTAATTSCTATGLSPGVSYSWTLTAVDHNWTSPAATAGATPTPSAVSATLRGRATDSTAGTQTSGVSGVTTTNGATLVILVYRQASNGNLGISSISGTAISGTPAAIASQVFNANGKYEVWAYRATGTGTANGTVSVNFGTGNNTRTMIDVVQLSGNSTASPVARSAVNSGTSATASSGALTGANASNGELFFAGVSSSVTMSVPSGYTALDASSPGTYGAWFSSSASASGTATTLAPSSSWGTIAVEITRG